jgi:hypothetical protein
MQNAELKPGFRCRPAGDRHEMISLIRSAVEQGVTFFDTAEVWECLGLVELVPPKFCVFRVFRGLSVSFVTSTLTKVRAN